MATRGTAALFGEQDIAVRVVHKVGEGRPNVVDRIINGEIDWIINTPLGGESREDERAIRRTALEHGLPMMTTLAAARAGIQGIRAMKEGTLDIQSLQEHHASLRTSK